MCTYFTRPTGRSGLPGNKSPQRHPSRSSMRVREKQRWIKHIFAGLHAVHTGWDTYPRLRLTDTRIFLPASAKGNQLPAHGSTRSSPLRGSGPRQRKWEESRAGMRMGLRGVRRGRGSGKSDGGRAGCMCGIGCGDPGAWRRYVSCHVGHLEGRPRSPGCRRT